MHEHAAPMLSKKNDKENKEDQRCQHFRNKCHVKSRDYLRKGFLVELKFIHWICRFFINTAKNMELTVYMRGSFKKFLQLYIYILYFYGVFCCCYSYCFFFFSFSSFIYLFSYLCNYLFQSAESF